MNTGNSVANYRVEKVDCQFCSGRGLHYIWLNGKQKMLEGEREIIKKFYDAEFVKTFSEIKRLWKELKKFGQVECPNCNNGKVEVWR